MKYLWLWLSIIVFAAGCDCGQGRVCGLSLSLGSFERGLWTDADTKNIEQRPTWGTKLDLTIGQWLRPVGSADGRNPWRGGKPAFVIRSHIPLPGIYLGVHIGELGFYIGTKTYEAADKHREDRYEVWMKEEEFGNDEQPKVYLAISASLRKTRWK